MKGCLGILSGLGAVAGMRLASTAITWAQNRGAKCDADYPEFLLHNLPFSAMDSLGAADWAILRAEIVASLRKMDQWGCSHIVIACNTAHYIFHELTKHCRATLINMVSTACAIARDSGAEKVGVFCSDTSRKLRLYEGYLEAMEIEPITSTDDEQAWINQAVEGVLTGRSYHSLQACIKGQQARGAQRIIVGCTELPVCLENEFALPLPYLIDAGQVTIERALLML